MNTRREAFSPGCSAFSSCRAAATSGRSCSAACRTFFECNLVAVVEAPDGAHGDLERLLAPKPVSDFLERQIWLFRHEIEQPFLVRIERQATVSGAGLGFDRARRGPAIHPANGSGRCEIEHTRDLSPALSLLDHRNRTRAQVLRVTLCHRFSPSLPTENSNLICATDGIPRGRSDSHQVESALACITAQFHAQCP